MTIDQRRNKPPNKNITVRQLKKPKKKYLVKNLIRKLQGQNETHALRPTVIQKLQDIYIFPEKNICMYMCSTAHTLQ